MRDVLTWEYGERAAATRVLVALFSLLFTLLSAVTIAAAIPVRYQNLRTVRPDATIITGQLNPEEAAALAELRLAPALYAGAITVLEATAAIFFLLLGAFVFWRRRGHPAVLSFALALVTFGFTASPLLLPLEASHRTWNTTVSLLRLIGLASLGITFLRFPDGQFVPRWSRWLAVIWGAYLLLAILVPSFRLTASLLVTGERQTAVLGWAFFWLLMIVALQIYRYRTYASSEQRQQTKWVVYGLIVAFGVTIPLSLPLVLLPSLRETTTLALAARMLTVTAILFGEIFLAMTVAIAILRFRLYDIDLLINRTVVYGLLTAALLLVYYSSIILLQAFLPDRSPAATVLSTLAAASLFTPLRRRIQTGIDRRFFRSKYNAAITLSGFAQLARDEVNLETLVDELVAVVAKTVQPAQVTIWLADDAEESISLRDK
jgi:hypothetical protein